MTSRHGMTLPWALLLLLSLGVSGAQARVDQLRNAPDKTIVTDGHVYHDAGSLWNHVTNWGLIGARPSVPTTFEGAPSARWPGETGDDYLWAAGLWVGGIVLGERLVSTGQFDIEFMASDAPGDTIFATARGATGGTRFPWPGADDDDDGLEDEDPLNGLDDDGDGLVDEDFAAIGDQEFSCGYTDFEPLILQNYPTHTPLNLAVVQKSIQWSSPLAGDFIGYDFTITNVGVIGIEQVHLGMFSDFDIGTGDPGTAEDDYAGFVSTTAQAADGTWVPVQLGYMFDGAAVGALDGYAGWVLCGHTTDPTGATAPAAVGVGSFQHFSGQAAYDQGGDPTNDLERYDALSQATWDPNALPGQSDDYRTLMSSGPFPDLAPGESVSYQVALVLGAGLDDLISNAAEAVATYRGVAYDRDDDPANGDEFVVNWLRTEDAPVPAGTGRLRAERVPGGVELLIETNLDPQDGLTVIRRAGSDVSGRSWTGSELLPAGPAGHLRLFQLLDADATGWPRTYDLVFGKAGAALPLDNVELDLPRSKAVELRADPNPFNPQVNIHFALPHAGRARLQIVDLQGRLVYTLFDGSHPGGPDTIVWSGNDKKGRAMASGVYNVLLMTTERLIAERITLVR